MSAEKENLQPSWAVYNKKGERMYQFGTFFHSDQASRGLALAREKYPDAGMCLRQVNQ